MVFVHKKKTHECPHTARFATTSNPEERIADSLECIKVNDCEPCANTVKHRETMMPGITERAKKVQSEKYPG